jgi:hypothetical protein
MTLLTDISRNLQNFFNQPRSQNFIGQSRPNIPVSKPPMNVIGQSQPNVPQAHPFQIKPLKLQNPIPKMVNNIGNQVSERIASIPYATTNIQRNLSNPIPVDWNTAAKNQNIIDSVIGSQKPVYQPLTINSFYPQGQQAPVSAKMAPNYQQIAPPTNPYLEGIKQQILNSPNVRPSARAYLSKLPIAYEKQEDSAGQAHRGAYPYIGINDIFNKPQKLVPVGTRFEDGSVVTKESQAALMRKAELIRIIKHELLHETPRLVPTEMFHPQNKAVVDHYTNQWGKDYMKRPKALVEEMFAEQNLPPAYYWHVFKNLNPKATKQDFVGYIKSWFVNNVNTPQAPIPSATPVPNGILGQHLQSVSKPSGKR